MYILLWILGYKETHNVRTNKSAPLVIIVFCIYYFFQNKKQDYQVIEPIHYKRP
jgi:hypothetical protein